MAVYPAQGVAQVTGIESKELMGKKVTFYILRIVDTDMKIMVPVDRSDAVGLRQVIDEDEIDGELFENFGNLVDFARAKASA